MNGGPAAGGMPLNIKRPRSSPIYYYYTIRIAVLNDGGGFNEIILYAYMKADPP